MIVTMLVLAAVVLAILGIVVSLMPPRPVSGVDESSIHTAEQLDAAMAIQRSMRIAELPGTLLMSARDSATISSSWVMSLPRVTRGRDLRNRRPPNFRH
jgi:hypothetical protein